MKFIALLYPLTPKGCGDIAHSESYIKANKE